ncbi:MAG: 16S rRNA (cytidine(1402)-2'-O)-methyltransferase [Bacillota bacterium]|jgi:16S rRNA (cytidine1402-2'-O)-methyltransferase|nr:16S rRNA (cytidine(1402)-2'-O)-methyltransferase [Bacillota bacterium]
MKGKLIVIPTPIGNLGDLTFRALEALKTVDLLLCEDTRHTVKLLHHYGIRVPLMSYHKFNEKERTEQIARRMEKGEFIGLVSDAGMPGVSDPGEILIRELIRKELPVEVLPGASAVTTALVGSGLPIASFLFLGFLSGDKRARKEQWNRILTAKESVVLYESPRRIRKTVVQLYEALGDRPIAICRELTKLHEEYIRGNLSALAENPEQIPEKGEIVLIIGPSGREEERADPKEALEEALRDMPLSQAVKAVAKETGLPRNELYETAVRMKEEETDGCDS